MVSQASLGLACRYLARSTATLMFFLLGAFFVHHLQEWFLTGKGFPPPWVWFAQALHGLALVGYAMGWRWERIGGLMVLVSHAVFFAVAYSGSPNRNWWFVAALLTPGVLYLASSWLNRPRDATHAAGPSVA